MEGPKHLLPPGQVQYIYDLTSVDEAGNPVRRQRIFPTLFELIDSADTYILLDYFLLNDQQGKYAGTTEPLAGELARHLIARKAARPELVIDLLTDPINSVYHSASAKILDRLRAAGINVIVTNLEPLRDSNPLYSVWWRLLLRWIPDAGHYLPHPFAVDGEKISAAGWLRLANFKANHRKVAVLDHQGKLVSLVASANPHGGSRNHSNVALLVESAALAQDLYRSEQAVAQLSGAKLQPLPSLSQEQSLATGQEVAVRVVTEAAIKAAFRSALAQAGAGDQVNMAMFYLADRQIVAALLAASQRGARVDIVFDPNRDAFGYEKNGVPNRPVAAELTRKTQGRLRIRWYRTHGEQFHTKLLLVERSNGQSTMILGSANLTRRNIGNYNLETDLVVSGPSSSPPLAAGADYFQRIWHNQGHPYTGPYEIFADDSRLRYLQYRLQESLGLGTF
ncbi:phospholipase D-like domain-containing protein [Pelobacter seleniigenes]|uniref:phospholipase D-like domain-containing protein n=1 Tax=Pelobacter seleniigenes TaxID=407188 RepID=UPI00138E1AE1|nr:phospholipase D-like domain-containing protein [Pelobacter seleniigenes]